MLQTLWLGPVEIDRSRVYPPVLTPLVRAAEQGLDLVPEIEAITGHFRFDSFMYGVATSPQPDRESCIYSFTTLPLDWVLRYDQMAYIEVDPRIIDCWDRTIPLVWDQETVRGRNAITDAFLDDAVLHGVASGVCLPLHDEIGHRILVAFNSASPYLDEDKQLRIAGNLGDMVIFANYFHELFMKSVVAKGLPPKITGLPLSARERECLSLAAHGHSTEAIAKKLGIAIRTVHFHFNSIRTKLVAANRQEAIALAIKGGQIAV